MNSLANFSYSARDASGALVKGTIDATNQGAAAQALLGRKLIPVKITEAKKAPVKTQSKGKDSAKKKSGLNMELFVPEVTLADLVIFSRQMNSLPLNSISVSDWFIISAACSIIIFFNFLHALTTAVPVT